MNSTESQMRENRTFGLIQEAGDGLWQPVREGVNSESE